MSDPMRFAYADPPYLGCGVKHYGHLHPDAADYDTLDAHRTLVDRLLDEYPDGWAMSLHTPSLRDILQFCPKGHRVGAWIKPFCAFKVNVNPAYAWEPVIFMGGRKRTRQQDTVRDWCAASITMKRGLTGAKPRDFCLWVLDWLNVHPGDVVDDIFPGSNAMGLVVAERLQQQPEPYGLFSTLPGRAA
jgi:hypothetical protein